MVAILCKYQIKRKKNASKMQHIFLEIKITNRISLSFVKFYTITIDYKNSVVITGNQKFYRTESGSYR
jgi:hypothetical protein